MIVVDELAFVRSVLVLKAWRLVFCGCWQIGVSKSCASGGGLRFGSL